MIVAINVDFTVLSVLFSPTFDAYLAMAIHFALGGVPNINLASISFSLKIHMISTFPLDYVHLVCLGFIDGLLALWALGTVTNHYHLRQPEG